MNTTWIGGPDDIRTGDDALDAIRQINDTSYYDNTVGVARVSKERWLRAQGYEERGWLHCWADQTDDRSTEHAALFNNYQDLKTDLGHVCEIGCGPFTQLQTIIRGRTAHKITLLDPLIHSYVRLKQCPYRHKHFNGYPLTLKPTMAEALTDFAIFDTVICINVLEHVMDAPRVMENLLRSLKAGGTIVFGERSFDDFDPHFSFDMGHPIHLKRPLLKGFRLNFKATYVNGDYFIGTK